MRLVHPNGGSKRYPLAADPSGFSLAEVVMAMAVAGVLMVGIMGTYRVQIRNFHAQEEVAAIQQNLRATLFLMEREIRMAGLDPTGVAGARILAAGSHVFAFSEDVDGDGTIDSNERIAYTLKDTDGDGESDELKRNGKIVAENIIGMRFEYYDENGVTTTAAGDIRSVRVSLLAASPDRSRSLEQASLIFCRNLSLVSL